MKKIDKKIWLILGIVIFAIVLGILVSIYSGQVKEQEQLSTNLAAQQAFLRKLTTDKEALEDKLHQAQSLLGTSRTKFPESVESIEYGEDLFKIADDCNLELTKLTPSMPGAKTAGAVTYSFSSFVVSVEGDEKDILDFISALRTGDDFRLPWSAEVKGVIISFGDAVATATITMDIYGYRG
jgi:type II secretory pathway pseudopilin PulG